MRIKRKAGQHAYQKMTLWLQLVLMMCTSYLGFYTATQWIADMAASLQNLTLILAVVVVTLIVVFIADRKTKQWLKASDTERVVGDTLDVALITGTSKYCAVAHNVSVTGETRRNIDHLVATPGKCWVVETRHEWMPKWRFKKALQRIAENVAAIRHDPRWPSSTEIKGCLVFATRKKMGDHTSYQHKGEKILLLGRQELYRKVRKAARADAKNNDEPLAKMVWKMSGVEATEVRSSGKQQNHKGKPMHMRRSAEGRAALKTILWSLPLFCVALFYIGFSAGIWQVDKEVSALDLVLFLAALIAAGFLTQIMRQPQSKEGEAKRVIGDTLDAALITDKCCAVAHGIFIKGQKLGDIDHLVVTPGKCAWVVETKYRRVPKDRFSETLRRIAGNMATIRDLSPSGTKVEGRLVFITEEKRKEYQFGKEKIVALDVKQLSREVRKATAPDADVKDDDGALAKMVRRMAGEEV